MTKEEFKILGEKIASNQATQEEILEFSQELNKEIDLLNKDLTEN